jgi:hypothetical protein
MNKLRKFLTICLLSLCSVGANADILLLESGSKTLLESGSNVLLELVSGNTFALSPTSTWATGTLNVTAVGTGTTWTTCPFSISSGPATGLTSCVVTDATHASFTITITSLGGTVVIADSNTATTANVATAQSQLSASLSTTHARSGVAVTVTASITNPATGDTTVTFGASVAGSWSATTVTLNSGTLSANRTFTPSTTGAVTFTATGNNFTASATPQSYYSDGTVYYASAAGNDSSDCQTIITPCLTPAGILTYVGGTWVRGDTYNFNGGDTFTGTATISISDANTGAVAGDLITFQSYGTGQATIENTHASNSVFKVSNSGGVKLDNLKISGKSADPAVSTQSLVVFDGSTANTRYNITISNNDITKGYAGIQFLPGASSAYDSPAITGNTIHAIPIAGIQFIGVAANGDDIAANGFNRTLTPTITGNTIHTIDGAIGASSLGQSIGIYLININGGTFSNNLIRDIAATSVLGGGAVVTVVANNITIAGNEIYNIHGPVGQDGSGIDVDWGSTNILVQYNYLHDIDGAALIAFENASGAHPTGQPTWANNTFRYNVIQNAAKVDWGAFSFIGDTITAASIYGNTFTVGAGGGNKLVYATTSVTNLATIKFLNNIFIGSTSAVGLISITAQSGTVAGDIEWKNNVFYTNAGNEAITDPSGTYTSIAAWEAATANAANNRHVDPLLTAAFTATTYNSPAQIIGLQAVNIATTSQAKNNGIDINGAPYSYGATRDFKGTPVPQNTTFDIGAIEFTVAGRGGMLLGIGQ